MIWSALLDRVERWGGRVALGVGERRITYSALAGIVESIARRWPETNGEPVRRVLVQQVDPTSLLLSILACWRRGIVPVVVRADAPGDEVRALARRLRPVDLLCERLDPDAIVRVPPSRDGAARFGPRDEALVLGTSGSTGVSKLVALPAESVCLNAATIAARFGLTHEDRVVVSTPMTYMCGLMGGAIAGLWAGAAVHLFSPRTPPSAVQARIRRDRLTTLQAPPSALRLFARYWNGEPFAGVRLVATGGEPLDAGTANEIGRMFPRAARRFCYGMTEAGPRISDQDLGSGRFAAGGIGRPYPHVEWRLDPVAGLDLPAGVGRFVLRGPTLFLGYLDPATGTYRGLDERGWFHSCDLVARDAAGELFFYGRTDRFFKSGGKLVDPASIERVLGTHPGVRAVRARPRPHDVLGLVPVVDVDLDPGRRVDAPALRAFCRQRLEPHAVPREIRLCAALPVTASGKLARAAGG